MTKTVSGTDEEGKNILNFSAQNLIFSYIQPYLKFSTTKDDESETFKWLSLDGSKREIPETVHDDNKHYSGTLIDGTYITIGWISAPKCTTKGEICGDAWIYLPGNKRQLGVTQFHFLLTKNGIKPDGAQDIYITSFEEYCDINNKSGVSTDQLGRGCTAWAIYQENMDYRRCDDLSWDGKLKCD